MHSKISEDFLAHYGIPGQKRGVRRFQYENRRWTPEGKIRYGRAANGKLKGQQETINGKKNGKISSDAKDEHNKKGGIDPELLSAGLSAIAAGGGFAAATAAIAAEYGVPASVAAKALLVTYPQFAAGGALLAGYGAYRVGAAVKSHYDAKKYNKERENNPIDKKTGFHKKTEEMSIEEDMKRVNPEKNNFNSNTKSNCMLCTTAYEMRRRGYDVRAEKAGVGYLEDDVKTWFPKSKVSEVRNDQGYNNPKYTEKVINDILKNNPEGARGNLMLTFGSLSNYSGRHSVAYEIRDGKVEIIDAQINRKYKAETLLRECVGVSYSRLDNVAFDLNGIKEACS